MFRGIVLALVLFTMVDVCFNNGDYVHYVILRLHHFATASSDNFNNSVFRTG